MITAGVESWKAFLPELRGIIEQHYEELALNRDRIPLVPRWDKYEDHDRAGSLVLVVVRKGEEAAGYFIGFTALHMHYGETLHLLCDIFYIKPEFRRGGAGTQLFQATEAEAARRGVVKMVVSAKLHNDASPLLRLLQYEPVETVFTKMIGSA